MPMNKSLLSIALGAAMLAGFAEPGTARRHEQDAAYDATRTGKIRPLREIENRVVPRMVGASYLGPEFDSDSATYRLKFMRQGSVIWVDVDGRTGAIIGRSGN
jgi:hypothetical protein